MELNQKIIDATYKLMEMFTKRCYWYHDTPEQPFKFTPGSIWLINPETENCMLELRKDGHLWYYDKIFDTFSKYLNMEESDFESFIKIWVEDSLERGVVSTRWMRSRLTYRVEDALERRVVSTGLVSQQRLAVVEDVLKKGKQLK